MLFEAGEEFAHTPGLGLLKGQVVPLPSHNADGDPMILPHMGWNRLLPGPAWRHAPPGELLNQYFVHSYAAVNVDPQAVLFRCRYGHKPFVAGVLEGAVVGFQFHPERSGHHGLVLLAQICGELLR